MGLVAVYEAVDELSALSMRDLLIQNGVPAAIKSKGAIFQLLGMVDNNFKAWGEILVEEENVEKALELISGFQGTLGELAELEGLPPGKEKKE